MSLPTVDITITPAMRNSEYRVNGEPLSPNFVNALRKVTVVEEVGDVPIVIFEIVAGQVNVTGEALSEVRVNKEG